MAKINLKPFTDKMEKVLSEISSPKVMRELGEDVADRIRKRTRLGRGVTDDGATRALKPLSSSYKDVRRGRVAFFKHPNGQTVPYRPDERPNLSKFTSPTKSNLTFTGQLLDSLKVTSATVGRAIVGLTGRRPDGLTNAEVGGYVSKDRPFLNLSKPEKAGLARLIRERIDALLKRS